MTTSAELNRHYNFAMAEITWALNQLQPKVPPPHVVQHAKGLDYRYREKTVYQALILKFVRLNSTLRATKLLLDQGQVLESAALQRFLDETSEDIMMLIGPLTGGKAEAIQADYLTHFWEEEFDVPGEPLKSTQKRGMVSRDKIQAYNARTFGGEDPSTMKAVTRSLFKAYSGFVHGSAVHILDVYDGHRFHVAGVKGTARHESAIDDFLNYVYRSVMTAFFIAAAFGDEGTMTRLKESTHQLGDRAGF